MIHLITVYGKNASQFFLKPNFLADFRSLVRTITSESVLVISTSFRSDIFYKANTSYESAILKMWALYTGGGVSSMDNIDFCSLEGDEDCLAGYFQSINALAVNWYYYNQYKRAFSCAFFEDRKNPLAVTLMQCDQHLVGLPCTKRTPLFCEGPELSATHTSDPFALAMRLLQDRNHVN